MYKCGQNPSTITSWLGLWTCWHLWTCWRLQWPHVLPAGAFRPCSFNSLMSTVQDLHLATTLDTLAWSVTLAFGASLGGAAVSKLGTTTCFLIDSATYVVAALCAWRLQVGGCCTIDCATNFKHHQALQHDWHLAEFSAPTSVQRPNLEQISRVWTLQRAYRHQQVSGWC